MIRNLIYGLFVLALFGFLVGCGQDSATSSNENESLADDFGGFDASAEAPGFGDPELISNMEGDEDYNDDILTSPEVDSLVNNNQAGVYVLRAVWGSLEYDSTITEITDWTGTLTISRGAIVVRKLIRFEPGQDYIIRPRTARDTIAWVSATTVHHDGIFFQIYVPPTTITDEQVVVTSPVTVKFETGPFSITFNLDELVALDTIYYLDDSVNAVAFRGFKYHPHPCPKGFLEGHWGVDSTGQGVFRGRWISRNGLLVGHLRGYWGRMDVDGIVMNIFYGKYIDLSGNFRGLLKGIYQPHPSAHANPNAFAHAAGWFYGHFYDGNGAVQGVLKGHYKMPRNDARGRLGYFAGRWKTYCGDERAVDDGFEE